MAGKITKFSIIILMIKLAAAQHDSNVRTGFFNLPVDHFSTTDRRTWDIRYFINEQHYREDGAIFIYVNDGTASDQLIQEGNMFEVADEEGAVLISLEQRYFGQSFPTPDASFENLQWLTVHQSVADVARFAGFMRQRYNNAPVIVWGRGRGASIAVWARQKYPNVIDGAWGSSALLNAIVEDVDFLPNVINTITQVGGAECGQVIADAFRMIEEAFEAGNTSYVETRLNTCDAIDVGNGYDLARLTYNIAFDLGFGFLKDVRYPEIDEKCFIMRGLDTPDNPPSDPLDAFARWYIDDFHFNRGIQCLPASNQQAVTDYQDPTWTGLATTSTRRQRLWLTCSQFGQFQVANHGQGHPFGTRFDLRFFERWCADAFENDM